MCIAHALVTPASCIADESQEHRSFSGIIWGKPTNGLISGIRFSVSESEGRRGLTALFLIANTSTNGRIYGRLLEDADGIRVSVYEKGRRTPKATFGVALGELIGKKPEVNKKIKKSQLRMCIMSTNNLNLSYDINLSKVFRHRVSGAYRIVAEQRILHSIPSENRFEMIAFPPIETEVEFPNP